MWRSCWGVLLLASQLCPLGAGHGVGAIDSAHLQSILQQVCLQRQAMPKASIKQA